MLSGLLSAVFPRRAGDEPVCRPCAVEVKTSGRLAEDPPYPEVTPDDFDVRWRTPSASGQVAALNGLRCLFLRRGVNVRSYTQLIAAAEDVCRELDAIRAQVGERLLRDMGLAGCGTPGSDDAPGWTGHDDDD
jgi:hypothetical protein